MSESSTAMYPPNRVASHDDFAMYNESAEPVPLHSLQAMFLHNPGAIFWKSAEKLNFAHLSTDSLSSMGTLSRSNSRDSMASADSGSSNGSNSPVASSYTLRGMFNAWEGNIALNTAVHKPDADNENAANGDDHLPVEPTGFTAVFFTVLENFLQAQALTPEAGESHVQFPRFC